MGVSISAEVQTLKTIRYVLDFFPDGRYMLLLHTRLDYTNVWLEKDGTITICFTDDDVKTLKELPRLYKDWDNLNKEYLFMKEKARLFRKTEKL